MPFFRSVWGSKKKRKIPDLHFTVMIFIYRQRNTYDEAIFNDATPGLLLEWTDSSWKGWRTILVGICGKGFPQDSVCQSYLSLRSAIPACGSLDFKHLVISCNLGKVGEHLFNTYRRYYQQPVAWRKRKAIPCFQSRLTAWLFLLLLHHSFTPPYICIFFFSSTNIVALIP